MFAFDIKRVVRGDEMNYPITCLDCGTKAKTTLFKGGCYWCGSHNVTRIGGIKMENQTHLNAVGEITEMLYEAKEAANDEPAV
jgi:Zn finger protein HypA/HybF involved in hydrogenase expression